MLSVFCRPRPWWPMMTPHRISTTTWGMRGRGSAATMMGASAAISDTANSVGRLLTSIWRPPTEALKSDTGRARRGPGGDRPPPDRLARRRGKGPGQRAGRRAHPAVRGPAGDPALRPPARGTLNWDQRVDIQVIAPRPRDDPGGHRRVFFGQRGIEGNRSGK